MNDATRQHRQFAAWAAQQAVADNRCSQRYFAGLSRLMRDRVQYPFHRFLSASWTVVILVAAAPHTAKGAEGDKPTGLVGVRHVLRASLSVEENSPYTNLKDGKLQTNLRVSVRISDHAPDADFFGVVVEDFAEVSPGSQGRKDNLASRQMPLDRGLPKVTVTGIEGGYCRRRCEEFRSQLCRVILQSSCRRTRLL